MGRQNGSRTREGTTAWLHKEMNLDEHDASDSEVWA